MEIVTKRFLLRDFVDSDESAFLAYQADPRMLEFYGEEEAKPGHARELLDTFRKWAQERPRATTSSQSSVATNHGGSWAAAGCAADTAAYTTELGIELAPQEWGRHGYAIEVLRALAKFGFDELGLSEIHGSTVSVNVRIARLASSLGAVATRQATPAWMTARGWSRVEWRVTREQWEKGGARSRGT